MEDRIAKQIAASLGISVKQVDNINQLHSEGSTIPFISRYRKEATGNLDEVVIGNVIEQITYFNELDKRKETVLKTIEEQGKLTPELKKRIIETLSATTLEDIYLPYKPKRKTKASIAIEKGLEPLATILFPQKIFDVESEALKFINEQVKDSAEALQGARDIMAEWIAENEQARNAVRQLFTEKAVLTSRVLNSKKDDEHAQKYKDYFDFNESLASSPSHRIMAIRRGEKEGFLIMEISVEKENAIGTLKEIFIKSSSPSSQQVLISIEDSYNR